MWHEYASELYFHMKHGKEVRLNQSMEGDLRSKEVWRVIVVIAKIFADLDRNNLGMVSSLLYF